MLWNPFPWNLCFDTQWHLRCCWQFGFSDLPLFCPSQLKKPLLSVTLTTQFQTHQERQSSINLVFTLSYIMSVNRHQQAFFISHCPVLGFQKESVWFWVCSEGTIDVCSMPYSFFFKIHGVPFIVFYILLSIIYSLTLLPCWWKIS